MGWGPTLHQNWGTNSATDGASVGVPLPHCSKFGECTSYWISWILGIAVSINLLQLGTPKKWQQNGRYIRYTPHLALGHWWICQWKNTYAKQKTYCTQKWMNYDHSHTKFIWWRYLSFPQYSTSFLQGGAPQLYIYVCLETPLSIIT